MSSRAHMGRAKEWSRVPRKKGKNQGGGGRFGVYRTVITRRRNANVITNALKNLWVSLDAQETAGTFLDAGQRYSERKEIRSESLDLWFRSRPSVRHRLLRAYTRAERTGSGAFSFPRPPVNPSTNVRDKTIPNVYVQDTRDIKSVRVLPSDRMHCTGPMRRDYNRETRRLFLMSRAFIVKKKKKIQNCRCTLHAPTDTRPSCNSVRYNMDLVPLLFLYVIHAIL